MSLSLFLLASIAGLKLGGVLWLWSLVIPGTHTYVGDDYPSAWPIKWPEKPIIMPIHDTVRYQLDTVDGAAEWAASIPNDGLIPLGDHCRPFSISMFHQIRCLDVLRVALVSTRSQNGTAIQHGADAVDRSLTRHCLNYLRQMVFCRSHPYIDPVLGYPQPNAHPDTDQCRDWSVVYEEARRSQQRCGT